MRIISGSHRGRRIYPPNDLPVRPTTDLAKESLFNILWNYTTLEGTRVLDLFSGTGNISYEFASRGCKEVVAVENNKRCYDFIRKTAMTLDFKNLKVIRADVFRLLKHPGLPYNIIFADAPYDMEEIATLPNLIFNANWLVSGGLLIIEHPGEINFTEDPAFLELRKYGKVHFTFFYMNRGIT